MKLTHDERQGTIEWYLKGFTTKGICEKLELQYEDAARNIERNLGTYKKNNPEKVEEHKRNKKINQNGYLVIYDVNQPSLYHIIKSTKEGGTRRNAKLAMRNNRFTHKELEKVYWNSPDDLRFDFHNRWSDDYYRWEQSYSYQQTGRETKRKTKEGVMTDARKKEQQEMIKQHGTFGVGVYAESDYLPMDVLILEMEARHGIDFIQDDTEREHKRRELYSLIRTRKEYASQMWGKFNDANTSVMSHMSDRKLGPKFLLSDFLHENLHMTYKTPKGSKSLTEVEHMGIDELAAYESGFDPDSYDVRSDPNHYGPFSDRSDHVKDTSAPKWGMFNSPKAKEVASKKFNRKSPTLTMKNRLK